MEYHLPSCTFDDSTNCASCRVDSVVLHTPQVDKLKKVVLLLKAVTFHLPFLQLINSKWQHKIT